MTDPSDNALWRFSLAVYGETDVEHACLRLQDDHGADVSLVLFCAWLGAAGYGRIAASQLESVLTITSLWNKKTVHALRALRRGVKEDPHPATPDLAEATRHKILAAELAAERALQTLLFDAVQGLNAEAKPSQQRANDAHANIEAYFRASGVAGDDDSQRSVDAIVRAAFSQEDAPG